MKSLTVQAPAKVNLYLEVLGRSGGFHRLETLFQTLAWADELVLTRRPAPGIELRSDAESIPLDASNLAWRAAAAYLAERPGFGGLSIDLRKRLPAGGGLGGGSSDAAAVLRGLCELDPDPPSPSELHALATALGSDVPFFLIGGCAHATGRGEILTPIAETADPGPVTLLLPPVGCATPAVFAALTEAERGPREAQGAEQLARRLHSDLPGLLHNRLTAAASRVQPALSELFATCAACGRPWLLSGSGSTCFVLGEIDPPPGIRAVVTRFAGPERAAAASRSAVD